MRGWEVPVCGRGEGGGKSLYVSGSGRGEGEV